MLDFEVGEATVSRYMPVRRRPPSQTWRSFLQNHSQDLVSIDFFVVPTATFRVLYVFLGHERQRIVHFNVTDAPSAQWTGQQLVNAFSDDSAPRSLWQNPYCERVIGTLRRECLDHVIVVGEQHLRPILRRCLAYYRGSRTHLALNKDAPEPRECESIDGGKFVALPMVGGPGQRDRATAVDEVGCAARKPGCGIGPYRRIASLDGGRFRAMRLQEKG